MTALLIGYAAAPPNNKPSQSNVRVYSGWESTPHGSTSTTV